MEDEDFVMPFNALTKNEYSGKNVVALLVATEERGYKVPAFVTFKQALELGRCVRKGEKAAAFVQKVVPIGESKDSKGRKRVRTACRGYWVFNIEQTDALVVEA